MSEQLGLNLPGGIAVKIRPDVVDHIAAHRQRSCLSREAGGQLFARIDGKTWTIVKATGPRKSDWRSRFGYHPNRKAENEEIKQLFAAGLHFVGDWHTHPERTPEPSGTDTHSMNDAVAQSIHELPGFIMLIVGTEAFPGGLWASFHSRSGPSVKLAAFFEIETAADASGL